MTRASNSDAGAPRAKAVGTMSFAGAGAAAIVMLLAALFGTEGHRSTPYYDVFGVLTVCKGVTGHEVIWGKTYTAEECAALEIPYIEKMYARMGQCVTRTDLHLHQVLAWGHFTYNSGNAGFCSSTAAKRLNAHRDDEACEQMMRWTKGTDRRTGERVDCAIRANQCYGLYDRRVRERAMCMGDLDAFKPAWKAKQ